MKTLVEGLVGHMRSFVIPDNWKREYPIIVRGEGVFVFDDRGKRYLDAVGGIHVVSIGHGVREVADELASQAAKIAFVNNRHFTTEVQEDLARLVVNLAPKGMARVYFVSSGSEANEVALQIAYQYHVERGHPSKHRIVARWHSYHGSTVGAGSMTGQLRRRHELRPFLLDFPHIAPPYCFRCPFSLTYPSCDLACAADLDRVIRLEGADSIAAFIAEPVVGTTGSAIVPPPGYYEAIRDICDRHDVLFIADETVTGFGRTGTNFGIDHWQAVPDIITAGKALSSGYAPISAVIISDQLWDTFSQGERSSLSLRSTYSGNPASAAAALAVQRFIAGHSLISSCARMGAYLKGRLQELAEGRWYVGDVRGLGLLLGVELVRDRDTMAPFARELGIQEQLVELARKNGLLIVGGQGSGDRLEGDHITISPPFVISEEECDELVERLGASLDELEDVMAC